MQVGLQRAVTLLAIDEEHTWSVHSSFPPSNIAVFPLSYPPAAEFGNHQLTPDQKLT